MNENEYLYSKGDVFDRILKMHCETIQCHPYLFYSCEHTRIELEKEEEKRERIKNKDEKGGRNEERRGGRLEIEGRGGEGVYLPPPPRDGSGPANGTTVPASVAFPTVTHNKHTLRIFSLIMLFGS